MDAIVVDVSTPSTNLDLELGKVHAAKAEGKTILVCHEKPEAKPDALPLRAGGFVSFRTMYWRAVPGLLIALFATYTFAAVVAGRMSPANAAWTSGWGRIALVMIPVTGLVVAAMLRRRLDRQGSKEIRVELRRLLTGVATVNASS